MTLSLRLSMFSLLALTSSAYFIKTYSFSFKTLASSFLLPLSLLIRFLEADYGRIDGFSGVTERLELAEDGF